MAQTSFLPAPYLFDANAFVDLGDRYYQRETFPCVWVRLEAAISAGLVVTCKMVVGELEKAKEQGDWRVDVLGWVKAAAIDEADGDIQAGFRRIAPLASPNGPLANGLSAVDLMVLATGEAKNLTIVTRDGAMLKACARGHVLTKSIQLSDFFKEMAWVFA